MGAIAKFSSFFYYISGCPCTVTAQDCAWPCIGFMGKEEVRFRHPRCGNRRSSLHTDTLVSRDTWQENLIRRVFKAGPFILIESTDRSAPIFVVWSVVEQKLLMDGDSRCVIGTVARSRLGSG